MTELAGKLAVVKVSGGALSLAEEGLTRVTDTQWRIATAAKQVIARDSAPALEYLDGTWKTAAYLGVNKLTGVFTFAAPGHTAGSQLRVKSGYYLPLSAAAYAHGFTYTRGIDLHDITALGALVRSKMPGLRYASGTISQWDVTDSYFSDALTSGEPVVIEFRGQEAGDPRRVWALLESVEMSAVVDGLQDEAVSFISTDALLNI